VLCFLESGDSSFTRYSGKPLEKLFECLSAFEIVEEGLDGDSRSTEHRSSAKNIGVFDDNAHERIVSRQVEHPGRRGTKPHPSSGGKPENHRDAAPKRRFSELRCGHPPLKTEVRATRAVSPGGTLVTRHFPHNRCTANSKACPTRPQLDGYN